MASMNEKDYYAILGISEDASTEDIRKAFQQKARKLHPDVNKEPDAEERFKEVSEAYAVLSDEGKRRRYDQMRSGSPFAGYGSTGYGGASYGGQGYSDYNGSPFEWGFPFGSYNRTSTTQSRAYRPRAGADIAIEITLNDDSASQGVRRGVTYQRYKTCEHCHGTGSVASARAETCPTCGGTGRLTLDLSSIFGFGVMDIECPECEGSGRVVANPCEVCGGSGRVLTADEMVVEVPAHSHDGDVVRIAGAGNAGTNGESAGDFVCRVSVPSEQLTFMQARGFHIMGFTLPFVVLGLFTNTLVSITPFFVVFAAMSIWMIIRGGSIAGHGAYWWRNAGWSLLDGAKSGLSIAIFTTLMSRCLFPPRM